MSAVCVYRAFDTYGRLLYVGQTRNVEQRLREHSTLSAWWLFHKTVEVTPYATREEAMAAEAEAIQTEYPRWNMVGRALDHPDGWAPNTHKAEWLAEERELVRAYAVAQHKPQPWRPLTPDEQQARITAAWDALQTYIANSAPKEDAA